MSSSYKNTRLAKPVQFFRIIREPHRKFGLPVWFVSESRNDLLESVFLTAPTGPEWEIELEKQGENLWFGNGWKDFVDYFSLGYGSLLVFRYEGTSHFKVLMIFDKSTREMLYPINISSSEEDSHDSEHDNLGEEEKDSEEDVSVENLGNRISKKRKTRQSSRTKDNMNLQHNSPAKGKVSIHPGKETAGSMAASGRCRSSETLERMQSSTTKRKTRASNLKPGKSVFKVVINQTYISAHFLHIPNSFSTAYFTNKNGNIILQDLDGRTWAVVYKVDSRSARFHLGWQEFAEDNKLQVGDTCSFETVEGREQFLRVTIIRRVEHANDNRKAGKTCISGSMPMSHRCRSSKASKRMKSLTRKRKTKASNHKSGRSVFKVVMKPSYLSRYLYIPAYFSNAYFTDKTGNIFLEGLGGRIWSVTYNVSDRLDCDALHARLGTGWNVFAEDNKLRTGDTCSFETVESRERFLRVTIIRSAEYENNNLTAGD